MAVIQFWIKFPDPVMLSEAKITSFPLAGAAMLHCCRWALCVLMQRRT